MDHFHFVCNLMVGCVFQFTKDIKNGVYTEVPAFAFLMLLVKTTKTSFEKSETI